MNVPLSESCGGSLSCQLTSPELIIRKKTVIAELKNHVIESSESSRGFIYTFPGSDHVLKMLSDFIITERECCPFFVFALIVGDEKQTISMELSGPEGAKDFIKNELGF